MLHTIVTAQQDYSILSKALVDSQPALLATTVPPCECKLGSPLVRVLQHWAHRTPSAFGYSDLSLSHISTNFSGGKCASGGEFGKDLEMYREG
jgi:hypothetical protein